MSDSTAMASIATTDSAWTEFRAELPLDALEAFRLASFNIEYVPQYAPIHVDPHAIVNRIWWLSQGYTIHKLAAIER